MAGPRTHVALAALGSLMSAFSILLSHNLTTRLIAEAVLLLTHMVLPLLVEHTGDTGELGVLEAFRLSATLVVAHLLEFIKMALIGLVLAIVGFLLLGAGLLVTVPLSLVALAQLYHQLVGVVGVKRDLAPVPIA
jgi:hypothetical protein